MTDGIRVGADVGGTFTDVALLTPGDELVTAKVPTTDDQSEGVLAGIRKACEKADLDPEDVDAFSHAMTVSTNALLEGDGAETALVTTEGFRDVLEIGRQDRPALYDLNAEKPDPLVPRRRRFEVAERATPEGVEREVELSEVRDLADRIRETDAESVAVSLLHAYADPRNERAVAEVLREELDAPVSASHEVLAAFREYERTATTVVDAYVTPKIDAYLGRLVERAESAGIPAPLVMQSNGGIADAETVREHAVTTCLSGPAAGVVGAAATAERAAAERATAETDGAAATAESATEAPGLVTFDMGGTSSDVSLVREGDVERTTETEIGGRPVGVPMVDVTTVGAGGGSIAWVDAGGALRVGPESAGADPGPACYGKGGERPTVTDANVVLGYLGDDTALGGELSLDVAAARDALAALADEADLSGPVEAARGVYRVANADMTRAVREVTVERGHDPRTFALAAFGGAGPMHAAALADRLDVTRVVVPRACGVLSAFGLLAADETRDAVRTYRTALDAADPEGVSGVLADLADEARADLRDPEAAEIVRRADLRYAGQSFELPVEVGESFDPEAVERRFHEAHETAYGYRMDEAVELVGLRVRATVARETPRVAYESAGEARIGEREADFGGEFREVPVYRREALPAGETFAGPAVCEQADSTVVVPPNWRAAVREDGTLVLTERGGEATDAEGRA
ncbi:hydantoinase/oxoprolinase family protein [Halorussus sp. MSC15.2]|uniref:hydantoinase/oxoprolinase family protein n=1 Tax=Halorussus sp. MSC15.2 TaxID=2283638 RepID=UPI0013D59239|nr:hydantoinase/oxoprolinase family protein [Halorussus sp. MSC15.2]NEU57730.1 hydantoinase/oxoprolinase family protein [Halorussus sp. MSC15.2]